MRSSGAAVTRAQAREHENPKPPKVNEMTSKIAENKEELVRLQEEDSTSQKLKAKGTETRKRYRISYQKRREIWCRIRQPSFDCTWRAKLFILQTDH